MASVCQRDWIKVQPRVVTLAMLPPKHEGSVLVPRDVKPVKGGHHHVCDAAGLGQDVLRLLNYAGRLGLHDGGQRQQQQRQNPRGGDTPPAPWLDEVGLAGCRRSRGWTRGAEWFRIHLIFPIWFLAHDQRGPFS